MKKEYKTTTGIAYWDEAARSVDRVDDPYPPDGEGWHLVSSALSEIRYSEQPILWFWEREVPAPEVLT